MATLQPHSTLQVLQAPTRRIWQHFDAILLAAVAFLVFFGVAMIGSTTLDSPSLSELPVKQIQFGVAGVIIMFIVTAIDYRYWQSLAQWLYGGVFLWLSAVFLLGLAAFGAQRWIDFFGLFFIQPSEMAKIGSIIWVATFFARNHEKLSQFRWVIASIIYAGLPVALILAQPDLSTSITIMIIWFSMAWAAGLRWRHIGIFVGSGIIALPIIWNLMAGFQRARILNFINPSLDPGAQFNINQALISIGSGGLFGAGYSQASQVQLRFLKVRHTDFIFSATASELGLVGVLIMLAVFTLVVIRILRIARIAGDRFGAYMCYGFAAVLFFQMLVNVGMNLNMMPVTGLPFPFVSYGGSSLLTFFVGIGLVQSVALRHKRIGF